MKKEDKIAILKGALKLLKSKKCFFICSACMEASTGIYDLDADNIFIEIPELLKYKPTKTLTYDVWWDPFAIGSRHARMNVIKKTIKDIESN
jgi:hypothetical protein